MVSIISARTNRITSVIWNSDKVMPGRIKALRPLGVSSPVLQPPISTVSPRPKAGSHCRVTENNRMNRIPRAKLGKEMPSTETNWIACANSVL